MAKTKKIIKNRNKSMKKKYMRKNKRLSRKIIGAGCNCGKILGGNINPASFNGGLDGKYYYPQNSETMNPNTPSFQIPSRNLPSFVKGGAKKRRMKKINGGSFTLLGDAYAQNPLVNFGTIDGASNSVNTYFANMPVNPSIIEQPAMRGYSKDLPPLA